MGSTYNRSRFDPPWKWSSSRKEEGKTETDREDTRRSSQKRRQKLERQVSKEKSTRWADYFLRVRNAEKMSVRTVIRNTETELSHAQYMDVKNSTVEDSNSKSPVADCQ